MGLRIDLNPKHSPHALELLRLCGDRSVHIERKRKACTEAAYYARAISTRRDFLALAGWANDTIMGDRIDRRNFLDARAITPQEFSTPEETFLVNFEKFMLDPEYGCRRPLLYEYFRDRLGLAPFQDVSCKATNQVYLSGMIDRPTPVTLDSSRIYQVHYLLASSGEALMSNWGHSMFRIIACAPHRKVPGPECLRDISYHLVLSFRANISDLVLDHLKGVLGGYPSQLFVMTVPEVIEEYNKTELRDLLSIPIRLSALEKKRFINGVLEHFWSYLGDYKFLSTNCATESYWLLRTAVRDRVFERTTPATPYGVLDQLEKAGRADRTKAIVFKSNRPQLVRSFGFVRNLLKLGHEDLDKFIAQTTPQMRALLFKRGVQAHPKAKVQIAANFYALESHAQRLKSKEIQEKVLQKLDHNEELKTFANRLMLGNAQGKRPWQLAGGAYGLPLEGEIDFDVLESFYRDLAALAPKDIQAFVQSQLAKLGFKREARHVLEGVANMRLFQDAIRGRDN